MYYGVFNYNVIFNDFLNSFNFHILKIVIIFITTI